MRSMSRKMLPALLAVLALGAVAASAAQAATEGPFYKIAGTRLAEGKSQEVKVKAVGQPLLLEAAERYITCNKMGVAAGAKLLGSTGANFGGGEATFEFSECHVSGAGEPCEVEKETLKTLPVKIELGYSDTTRAGEIPVLLVPATKTLLAEVKLVGNGCGPTTWKWYGSLPGRIEEGKKVVEVGKEPAAAKTVTMNLGAGAGGYVTKMWLEKSGSLVEEKGLGPLWENSEESQDVAQWELRTDERVDLGGVHLIAHR